ncbi:MAG TPA: hypothetical protein ACFCUC_12550 [Desulfobacterales bacterium]
MHLYWRIQQDLECLREFIRFEDPVLSRSFRQWLRKNFAAVTLAEDLLQLEVPWMSLN